MPVIDITDFHYAYPSLGEEAQRWVLRGLNLTVEAGTCLGVMGATGAGKTTLCQAMSGIVPQLTGGTVRGDVRVLGMDPRHTPVPDLACRIGLVFQDAESQLFNLSVEEEIAFGLESLGLPPDEITHRVAQALEDIGLADDRQRSPFELSGGEKQRLAIAATLAMGPDLLILDEPISHVDPVGKRAVRSLVAKLARNSGSTIVIVEQDADWLAEIADRVVVLSDGRVAMDGPAAQILTDARSLLSLGVGPPQLSELAAGLNQDLGTGFAFTVIDDAERALKEALGGSR